MRIKTWCAAALMLAACGTACSDPPTFQIASGAASYTLNEFGRQSGIQLLFDFVTTGVRTTRSIEGKYEPRDALRKMLEGTDLDFAFVNERTLAVTPRDSRPRHQNNNDPDYLLAPRADWPKSWQYDQDYVAIAEHCQFVYLTDAEADAHFGRGMSYYQWCCEPPPDASPVDIEHDDAKSEQQYCIAMDKPAWVAEYVAKLKSSPPNRTEAVPPP